LFFGVKIQKNRHTSYKIHDKFLKTDNEIKIIIKEDKKDYLTDTHLPTGKIDEQYRFVIAPEISWFARTPSPLLREKEGTKPVAPFPFS
jgi:hypothetical protein